MTKRRCGGHLSDGGGCPFAATTEAGGVALCETHLESVREALGYGHASEALRVGLPAHVYYIGDPASQLVKIGTTTGVVTRLTEIRRRRPRAVLLACEPGSFGTEAARHRLFAHLNRPLGSGEKEWFRKEPELMLHVSTVRAQYGIPRTVRAEWVAPLLTA